MSNVRAGGLRLLRATTLWNSAAIVVLIVLMVVAFFANQKSMDALCALRGDLTSRVASSREFLKDHPNGFADVPAKTIRDSIDNQMRTINALSVLSC